MLGDLLGEEHGKIVGYRVLSTAGPRVEVSFRASGKILGVETMSMGTYVSVAAPGGSMHGEGQGFVTTGDGEMATWSGSGVGKLKPGGAASWRGAIFYQTTSPKLARLNGIAAVFEFEVDSADNTSSRMWEWK